MFKKGDVYTIEGNTGAIRWVGVVTNVGELGNVTAIEMAYGTATGVLIGVSADAYFNVERPGQRVLLQVATKEEVENA